MALIIEDGSIVENANSYVDRATIIAYAGLRGVLLANDDTTDVKAIKAMDYLEMFRDKYVGREVSPGVQPLAWPRECAIVNGGVIASNAIPKRLKDAQCALVIEVETGTNLIPTTGAGTGGTTGGELVREKIGPLEFEYAEGSAGAEGMLPTMPGVSALLSALLSGFSGPTRTYRV